MILDMLAEMSNIIFFFFFADFLVLVMLYIIWESIYSVEKYFPRYEVGF